MKKTLITLAVAASAVVSGAAMAAAGWKQSGLGGTVELSGKLTPADHVTPWEVKTGDPKTGLDAFIKKGARYVEIEVKGESIPVLGIRTHDKGPFQGTAGISPQIDFRGALGAFETGSWAPLTMDVKSGDQKIGKVVVNLRAAAVYSYTDDLGAKQQRPMFASASGNGFYGGLPSSADKAFSDPLAFAQYHFPEASANYNNQGIEKVESEKAWNTFGYTRAKFSAFYASAIPHGQVFRITLDNPVSDSEKIQWKASLPVVVSYM
ncbi:hypothetical protein NGB58_26245 [Escherichia coli]|nr:hypothetical protein [Escherichia coli]